MFMAVKYLEEKMLANLIAVAPMLDWTDRHCRYFFRMLAPNIVTYTEMVTAPAILHGPRERLLQYHPIENPVILQLGGSKPEELSLCAQIAAEYQYTGINLNVGCPSSRVSEGRFGACLMVEPNLVAECIAAMREVVTIPISVKTRIGIDEHDSYAELCHFIATVAGQGGCKSFIIHARKAWLKGLSPKENREIPPLKYDVVYQLKQDFPELHITLNGGIKTLMEIEGHLNYVDAVMIGRAAYQNPYFLAEIQQHFWQTSLPSRQQIITAMLPYLEEHLQENGRLWQCVRHMLGLYQGIPGARSWRRHLSEHAIKPNAGVDVLLKAMDFVAI